MAQQHRHRVGVVLAAPRVGGMVGADRDHGVVQLHAGEFAVKAADAGRLQQRIFVVRGNVGAFDMHEHQIVARQRVQRRAQFSGDVGVGQRSETLVGDAGEAEQVAEAEHGFFPGDHRDFQAQAREHVARRVVRAGAAQQHAVRRALPARSARGVDRMPGQQLMRARGEAVDRVGGGARGSVFHQRRGALHTARGAGPAGVGVADLRRQVFAAQLQHRAVLRGRVQTRADAGRERVVAQRAVQRRAQRFGFAAANPPGAAVQNAVAAIRARAGLYARKVRAPQHIAGPHVQADAGRLHRPAAQTERLARRQPEQNAGADMRVHAAPGGERVHHPALVQPRHAVKRARLRRFQRRAPAQLPARAVAESVQDEYQSAVVHGRGRSY